MRHTVLASIAVLGLVACGPGAGAGRGTTAGSIDVPERITEDNYGQYSRILVGLAYDDPSRAQLRDRLIAHLEREARPVLSGGEYEAVVTHFSRMTALYRPEEIGRGDLASELIELARFIRLRGAPRGDEGRVLSALLVLSHVEPDGGHDREYRELAEWGRDARSTLPSPLARYSGMIDVWEEHARLTPSPEVLDTVARLHVERRDAILQMMPGDGQRLRPTSPQDLRLAPLLLRRAPLDVAGVYLAQGDLTKALTHVEAMGNAGELELHLMRILREGIDGEDDALDELIDAYHEQRPDIARGLAALGRRRSPEDSRFPRWLAQLSAIEGDFADSTGWYEIAVDLDPDDRELYDEALLSIAEFIRRGRFESDPAVARWMARTADRLLRERLSRWPDDETDASPENLHYFVGMLEMNAGNAEEAKRRFERSLEARETADVHVELGRLAERTGESGEAARHYRRALDLTTGDTVGVLIGRARITEFLGDAFRGDGNGDQAERMYRQALNLWDQATPRLDNLRVAEVQVRRGILLDRLGRHDEAATAFRRAMDSSPNRADFATMLSHLVVASRDVALAREVFRNAQRQLTLEPEWKVYFALWVELIAARAGQESGESVASVLQSYEDGEAWFARLARFGTGNLPYNELLREASSVGERTEAHFYEGTRLLATGDRDGARQQFRRVLETRLVNFYEFTMALELLGEER